MSRAFLVEIFEFLNKMIELREREEESDDSDDMCLRKNEGDGVSFEVDEAIEHVKFGKYQIYLIVFIGSIWSTGPIALVLRDRNYNTHTHTHTQSLMQWKLCS